MFLKPGQKVLITTTHHDEMDGDSAEQSKMITRYGGTIMTVNHHMGGDWYAMMEDDSFWDWHTDMFTSTSQTLSNPIKKETLPEI